MVNVQSILVSRNIYKRNSFIYGFLQKVVKIWALDSAVAAVMAMVVAITAVALY